MYGVNNLAVNRDRLSAAISARSLFSNGEPGLWYDNNDDSTVFQDSVGTTLATWGDPVGLQLDKHEGLAKVQVPNGFPYTPPFTITQTGPQQYTTNFDPDDYIVTGVGATYYLSPTGNDSNDGLTPENPKKSIGALVTALNSSPPTGGATLYLAPGSYENTDSLFGVSIGFDCNLICETGKSVLTYTDAVSWSKTGGRTNIWEAVVTGSPAVVDFSNLDSYDIEVRCKVISTGDLGTLDNTPNAIAFGGGKVYIHTFDGRAPDSDIVVYNATTSRGYIQTTAQSLFFRNVQIFGFAAPLYIDTSGADGQFVFDQCSFRYGSGALSGFGTSANLIASTITIVHECDSAYHQQDGFGYNGLATALEIGCKGVWNGYVGTNPNDNGSTTHDDVISVRVNGVYRYNHDRNIHDIESTSNWLVGCQTGDAQNTSTDPYDNANFLAGREAGSDATKTWLEGCTSFGGSASDVGAYGDSVVETYDCVGLDIEDTDGDAIIRDNAKSVWIAGNHRSQTDDALRPTRGRMPKTGKWNELVSSDNLATQNVTVTAAQRTLSFTGTGTVTLSGVSTDGPLVGTGSDRVSLTFTPSAGTLTLTVSGDVQLAQLQTGAAFTAYQSVGATGFDVIQAGQQSCGYIAYNGVDQFLKTTYTLDLSAVDEVSVFFGVSKNVGTPTGILLEHNSPSGTNNGSFAIFMPTGVAANSFNVRSRGTSSSDNALAGSLTAPNFAQITALLKISTDTNTVRKNGALVQSTSTNQGSGNYADAFMYFGSSGGTLVFGNVFEFSTIVRGSLTADSLLVRTEQYVARQTPTVNL